MRRYQSLEEIRKAEVEELKALPSMNERAARSVYDFFIGRKSTLVEVGALIWYDE